jgi:RNA polymerase Rpb2, domain 6/RNA polymerase Rpb1, domain 2
VPTLSELQTIKVESDRGNYGEKTRQLRALIESAPEEWMIDSEEKGIAGITHNPTGFRYHLPSTNIPNVLRGTQPRLVPQTATGQNTQVKTAEELLDFKTAAPTTGKTTGTKPVVPSVKAPAQAPAQVPAKPPAIRPIAAIKNGAMAQVMPDEVEYEALSPSHTWAESTHMAPLLGNMKGARAFIASKYVSQAMPLKEPEAPLVDTIDEDDEEGGPFNRRLGKSIGLQRSSVAGVVHSVHNNTINIFGDDGKIHSQELHYFHPSNRKTHRTDKPLVAKGDRVELDQPIAHSNYVTPDGTLALGRNLRVAFVPGPHGSTFEDAIAVSQSAANKLSSSHLYGYDLDHDNGVQSSKKKFLSLFPNKYTNEQLEKIGEDGHAVPGAILNPGDPIILAYQPRNLSTKDSTLGNLHKVMRNSFQDLTQTWEKPSPGTVADAVKTRKGLAVNVATDMPLRVGDKISARSGAKGVISRIFADDQMYQDGEGKPVDILINPAAMIGRVNPTMIYEALLGKIANKRGKPYYLPSFSKENTLDMVEAELAKHGVQPNEDLFDPETSRKVPNVLTGIQFFQKLEHTSESKESGRGEGGVDLNEQPTKGGSEGSKRLGGLVNNALLSHGAIEVLKDAKLNRGSKNAEMWTRIRNGESLPAPKVPFVFNKFIATLQGAGINVKRKADKLHLFAMTDKDVDEMAPHEVLSGDTVDPSSAEPVKGGLFDPAIFGANGDRWSKIPLDQPIPNPLMEDPIRSFLKLTKPMYREIIAGRQSLGGKTGAAAIEQAVRGLNFSHLEKDARDEIKNGRKSKRDEAVKRLKHAVGFQRMGLDPSDLIMNKVPVLPTTYRPVSKMNGMLLVSDANYLYGDLIKAQNALRVNRNDLPDSELGDEKLAVYDSIKAVQGLGDPINQETAQKGVKGFLRTISGSGGPKTGFFLSKVVGHPVNTVGRSVIIPNADLNMDEIGIPEKMAWNMYAPHTMGRMVRDGMSSTEAARHVESHSATARKYLLQEMEYRPALVSRDPALHRFSIMGAKPKLMPGSSIQLSPLVVKGYGADFDGDAMNVHIPVSDSAVSEVKERLLPSKNLFSLKDRSIFNQPSQEFILGLHNATSVNQKKPSQIFNTREEAKAAYNKGLIDLDTPIQILS